jgi:hypothetical protein
MSAQWAAEAFLHFAGAWCRSVLCCFSVEI